MENADILQAIFIGWVLGTVASMFKAFAPFFARKRAIKNGSSPEDADKVYEKEAARIYSLSKGYGAFGGWYIVALILAVHGGYPPITVTLSWVLAITLFAMNAFQALPFNELKSSNRVFFGFMLIPLSLVLVISITWLLIISAKVIF